MAHTHSSYCPLTWAVNDDSYPVVHESSLTAHINGQL